MTADDPLAAALERLWRTNGPELRARGDRVLAALIDRAAGTAADTAAAAGDAHVLAGALGTYGRSGSEVFAAAEQLLTAPGQGESVACAGLADEVRRVLAALT